MKPLHGENINETMRTLKEWPALHRGAANTHPIYGERIESYHRRLAEVMEKKIEEKLAEMMVDLQKHCGHGKSLDGPCLACDKLYKALDKPRKVWMLLEYMHGPKMMTKELVGLHVFDSEQKAHDKKTELSRERGQEWDIVSKEIQ